MNPRKPSLTSRLCLSLALLLFLFGVTIQPLPAVAQADGANSPRPGVDFVAGEVLVQFSSDVVQAEALNALADLGVAPQEALSGGLEVWSAPEGSELEVVKRLEALPSVVYAQPNYIYRMAGAPDDTYYSQQWAHQITNAEAAWDITTGSSDIIIAVLDTGVDLTHPEFAGKIVHPADYVTDDGDDIPQDENAHGTHVAGIAAGQGNNGQGIAGVSWNAKIMPVQVLGADGRGDTAAVREGIRWAYQHGAKVINMSLAGEYPDYYVQQAITEAHNAGVLVVAASGNEATSQPRYPAAMNHVLAVGATDHEDKWAYYSNTGTHLDVVAPGGDKRPPNIGTGIYSTTPMEMTYQMLEDLTFPEYDYFQGTSMAAPYVSGLAALILSLDPGLGPDEVEQIIKESAVDLGTPGWDSIFGYGRVDVLKALQVTLTNRLSLAPISNADKDGNYLVDWTDVDGAANYELQEDDNPSFSSPSLRYNGTASQFQVVGQPTGIWYYRVRARVNGNYSAWSNTQSVTVLPSAPVLNPIANPDQLDAYRIQWGSVAGAQRYTLEQSSTANFSKTVVRYQGTDLKYDVTGQPEGVWYYRVRAQNLAGVSAWSAVVSTEVKPSGVDAPRWKDQEEGQEELFLTNYKGNGQYTMSWQAVSGAEEYILESSSNPYFVSPQVIYQGDQLSFEVKDQRPGIYNYRVRAATPEAMSPWSITARVEVRGLVYLPLLRR